MGIKQSITADFRWVSQISSTMKLFFIRWKLSVHCFTTDKMYEQSKESRNLRSSV